ncbi:MAG: hypothetical protein ABIJ72_00515 [bacterium]
MDPDHLVREVRKLERLKGLLRRSVVMTEFPWGEVLTQAEAMDWSMEGVEENLEQEGQEPKPIQELLEAICVPTARITRNSSNENLIVVAVGRKLYGFAWIWHYVIEALI